MLSDLHDKQERSATKARTFQEQQMLDFHKDQRRVTQGPRAHSYDTALKLATTGNMLNLFGNTLAFNSLAVSTLLIDALALNGALPLCVLQ